MHVGQEAIQCAGDVEKEGVRQQGKAVRLAHHQRDVGRNGCNRQGAERMVRKLAGFCWLLRNTSRSGLTEPKAPGRQHGALMVLPHMFCEQTASGQSLLTGQ